MILKQLPDVCNEYFGMKESHVPKKIQKKYKISKKDVAKSGITMYTNKRCGMIAVKREVAGCQR
ncbi:hypothetical protein [Acetatifactor muris]|uniref:hypothetical protein n=1 Tax=Acetatifactor muris TaxID=879566 RepID=UPI0023F4ED7A|nr:hypothetical protein [Acetatifactor muris]